MSSRSTDTNLGILEYRMEQVEKQVSGGLRDIGEKLDRMSGMYVTSQTLELILKPWRDSVATLVQEKQDREKADSNNRAQLRIALVIALFSPLVSVFITLILDRR